MRRPGGVFDIMIRPVRMGEGMTRLILMHRDIIHAGNRRAQLVGHALGHCRRAFLVSNGPGMLGVFAEFETALRKERQMEGIAKAKERGVYKGRKATIDLAKVKELRDGGLGASAIAKKMGICRASVYRALQQ